MFALIARYAHGSPYINELDLSEPVPSASLAYVTAQYVPTITLKASSVEYDASNSQSDLVAYLRSIAGPLFNLEYRIVKAESGWHPDSKNKLSTASGLAQYLTSTFQSQCINKYHFTDSMVHKNDPYVQLNCLHAMIRDGGQSHWNASRTNWE